MTAGLPTRGPALMELSAKRTENHESAIERQADLRELQDRPPRGQGVRHLHESPPQATARLSGPDRPARGSPSLARRAEPRPGRHGPGRIDIRRIDGMPRILGVDIPNDTRTL